MLNCGTNIEAATGRGDSCWHWREAISEAIQVRSTKVFDKVRAVDKKTGYFTLHSHSSAILAPKVGYLFFSIMTDADILPQVGLITFADDGNSGHRRLLH